MEANIMAENWLEDLEKDLEVIKKENHLVNNVKVKIQKSDPSTLIAIAIMLFVSILCVWVAKNVSFDNWYHSTPIVQPKTALELKFDTYVDVMEQRIDYLTKQYEATDTTAQKIWERTKWSSDRISLLAIINNHNLVVEQYNLPKSELILLRADWTIDRMPNRVVLDDESKELLQKFIR